MTASTPQPDTEKRCPCGLNLNIWQNSWNHQPGCSMQPSAPSEPPTAAEEFPCVFAYDRTECIRAGHIHPLADAPEQQDDEPTREDRGVAMGLVRQARAANSDDEVDAARDAIAREIATERALASRRPAEADQHEQLAALFLEHQRPGISPCKCGGMRLGESYPHHLADVVLSLLSAPAGPAEQDGAR